MTQQDIRDRIAELQEEYDFYMENRRDFGFNVYDELQAISEEIYQLEGQLIVTDTINALENINTYIETVIAEEEQTIEVVALPASDDWLDEELDAMIADPAGTRFLAENAPETAENSQETSEVTRDVFVPYFASYAQFLLWVTGQAVRGITYIRRILNELSTSTSSVEYAA